MNIKKLMLCHLAMISGAQAGTLTIAPDISTSSAIMTNQIYADVAANAVAKKVAQLTYGDSVVFKMIGDDSLSDTKSSRLVISRKMRPEKASALVKGRIQSLGKNVAQQGSTNILSFIENGEFYCDQNGSMLLLLTDGIEWSIDYSGSDLLAGKPLPEPYGKPLEGCDVVMVGVGRLEDGQRLPRQQMHKLHATWDDWMTKAGARSVKIMLNPQ